MANREKGSTIHPLITVVIGTLNRPTVVLSLIRQLEEVAGKSPLEVMVIDQSLPDNHKQLASFFPQKSNFKLIHFDKPNTCKYLNYGWRHAESPLVLYLDDDVTITETTIQAHVNTYATTSVMGVSGRVINDGEQTATDKRVGHVLWYGAEFAKNFSYDKSVYVDYPYGCNMSFRRSVLEKIGGFDELLAPPIYAFNEVDLGVRISRQWKNSLIFSPEALVYHHQYKRGGTRNDFDQKKIVDGNNFNYGYFLGKNYSIVENVICFLRRFPFQAIKNRDAIPAIMQGFISSRATKAKSSRMRQV